MILEVPTPQCLKSSESDSMDEIGLVSRLMFGLAMMLTVRYSALAVPVMVRCLGLILTKSSVIVEI